MTYSPQNYKYKAVLRTYLTGLATMVCALGIAQGAIDYPPSKPLTKFSFLEFNGGVILMRAYVEGFKDSLNFILDSGSGGASLDSSTCEEFNIKPSVSDSSVYGIGSKRQAKFVYGKTLGLPGLTTPPINFHVNDYSLLSSVYGVKIDGLLGYHLFRNYILKVDFDHKTIELFSPGAYAYDRKGFMLTPVFTAIPIQEVTTKEEDEKRLSFYLDSGAGLALLLSDSAADNAGLLHKKKDAVTIQAEGMSSKVEMKLTTLKKLKLGPFTFKAVPAYIYKDDLNILQYPLISGLLGNELMSRFNIVYNYPSAEIHITPNTRFRHKFDYSYTGMSIYYHDGKIIIEEVVPESPAGYYGVKNGDVLVGINSNFSGNIIAYKNLLNKENEEMRLFLERNGNPVVIDFFTADIRSYSRFLKRMKRRASKQ